MSTRSSRRRLRLAQRRGNNKLAASQRDPKSEKSEHHKLLFKRFAFKKTNSGRVLNADMANRSKDDREHASNERAMVSATRRLRDFTAALVFVSIASAGVTALQWWELHSGSADTSKLANAAKSQADAIRDQLDLMKRQQRPFIQIASVTVDRPLVFTASAAYLDITFNINILGHAIAENVAAYGEFFMQIRESVVDRQKAACAQAQINSDGEKHGFTVFPGTFKIPAEFVMQKRELQKWILESKRPVSDSAPMLVGCLDYVFEGEHHETGFALEIDKRGGLNGFDAIDPTGGDVPADLVAPALSPWYVSKVN